VRYLFSVVDRLRSLIFPLNSLLAAYDLGATAAVLKKIEKRREKMQRPIQLDPKDKDIVITDQNWVQYVGNSK
jgi:hypothetical protein